MHRSVLLFTLLGVSCDAAPEATAPATDAAVEVGTCNFNDECPEGRRCACVDASCTCEVGPRGAGRSGVDGCVSGNDCASGVCVEGQTGFVCSGRCDSGCGDKLPRCADIGGVGRICVRDMPPAATGATGTFGGDKYSFAHAFFGHDYGDSGPIATLVELHAGSDGACPPPKSDPDATVVIAGLPGTVEGRSYGSGLRATLLGFDPRLPIKSTAKSVEVEVRTPTATTLDLTVAITFAEGTVTGSVRAIHCDSMDVR